MNISLNIVLDALSPFSVETHIDDAEPRSFNKCLPLSEAIVRPDPECLYYMGLSAFLALRRARNISGICCVCWRDRICDSAETPAMLGGLIIVNENITPTAIITRLQQRFYELMNWARALIKR
jgi:hypothetical protein